jgi:hypothetical protein
MKIYFIVVAIDDDDEVRTSVSQNHATATLCTEEFSFNIFICFNIIYIAYPRWHGFGGLDKAGHTPPDGYGRLGIRMLA